MLSLSSHSRARVQLFEGLFRESFSGRLVGVVNSRFIHLSLVLNKGRHINYAPVAKNWKENVSKRAKKRYEAREERRKVALKVATGVARAEISKKKLENLRSKPIYSKEAFEARASSNLIVAESATLTEQSVDSEAEILSRVDVDELRNRIMSQPTLYRNRWDTLVRAYLYQNRFPDALRCLADMTSVGHPPTKSTFTILMDGLGRKGNMVGALEIYREMQNRGMEITVVTQTVLVNALIRSGDLPGAAELVRSALRDGVKDTVMLTSLMQGYSDSGDYSLAEETFALMRSEGVPLDAVVYTTAIHVAGRQDKVEQVLLLLEEFEATGQRPTVELFNSAIQAAAKSPRMHREAFGLFARMRTAGLAANVRTYSGVIQACAMAGEVGRAREYFAEMLREGIAPSVFSFNQLLGAYMRALRAVGRRGSRYIAGRARRAGLRGNAVRRAVSETLSHSAETGLRIINGHAVQPPRRPMHPTGIPGTAEGRELLALDARGALVETEASAELEQVAGITARRVDGAPILASERMLADYFGLDTEDAPATVREVLMKMEKLNRPITPFSAGRAEDQLLLKDYALDVKGRFFQRAAHALLEAGIVDDSFIEDTILENSRVPDPSSIDAPLEIEFDKDGKPLYAHSYTHEERNWMIALHRRALARQNLQANRSLHAAQDALREATQKLQRSPSQQPGRVSQRGRLEKKEQEYLQRLREADQEAQAQADKQMKSEGQSSDALGVDLKEQEQEFARLFREEFQLTTPNDAPEKQQWEEYEKRLDDLPLLPSHRLVLKAQARGEPVDHTVYRSLLERELYQSTFGPEFELVRVGPASDYVRSQTSGGSQKEKGVDDDADDAKKREGPRTEEPFQEEYDRERDEAYNPYKGARARYAQRQRSLEHEDTKRESLSERIASGAAEREGVSPSEIPGKHLDFDEKFPRTVGVSASDPPTSIRYRNTIYIVRRRWSPLADSEIRIGGMTLTELFDRSTIPKPRPTSEEVRKGQDGHPAFALYDPRRLELYYRGEIAKRIALAMARESQLYDAVVAGVTRAIESGGRIRVSDLESAERTVRLTEEVGGGLVQQLQRGSEIDVQSLVRGAQAGINEGLGKLRDMYQSVGGVDEHGFVNFPRPSTHDSTGVEIQGDEPSPIIDVKLREIKSVEYVNSTDYSQKTFETRTLGKREQQLPLGTSSKHDFDIVEGFQPPTTASTGIRGRRERQRERNLEELFPSVQEHEMNEFLEPPDTDSPFFPKASAVDAGDGLLKVVYTDPSPLKLGESETSSNRSVQLERELDGLSNLPFSFDRQAILSEVNSVSFGSNDSNLRDSSASVSLASVPVNDITYGSFSPRLSESDPIPPSITQSLGPGTVIGAPLSVMEHHRVALDRQSRLGLSVRSQVAKELEALGRPEAATAILTGSEPLPEAAQRFLQEFSLPMYVEPLKQEGSAANFMVLSPEEFERATRSKDYKTLYDSVVLVLPEGDKASSLPHTDSEGSFVSTNRDNTKTRDLSAREAHEAAEQRQLDVERSMSLPSLDSLIEETSVDANTRFNMHPYTRDSELYAFERRRNKDFRTRDFKHLPSVDEDNADQDGLSSATSEDEVEKDLRPYNPREEERQRQLKSHRPSSLGTGVGGPFGRRHRHLTATRTLTKDGRTVEFLRPDVPEPLKDFLLDPPPMVPDADAAASLARKMAHRVAKFGSKQAMRILKPVKKPSYPHRLLFRALTRRRMHPLFETVVAAVEDSETTRERERLHDSPGFLNLLFAARSLNKLTNPNLSLGQQVNSSPLLDDKSQKSVDELMLDDTNLSATQRRARTLLLDATAADGAAARLSAVSRMADRLLAGAKYLPSRALPDHPAAAARALTEEMMNVYEDGLASAGVRPDAVTVNTVFSALCASGDRKRIEAFWRSEFRRHSVVPSIFSFRRLIRFYVDTKQLHRAAAVLKVQGAAAVDPVAAATAVMQARAALQSGIHVDLTAAEVEARRETQDTELLVLSAYFDPEEIQSDISAFRRLEEQHRRAAEGIQLTTKGETGSGRIFLTLDRPIENSGGAEPLDDTETLGVEQPHESSETENVDDSKIIFALKDMEFEDDLEEIDSIPHSSDELSGGSELGKAESLVPVDKAFALLEGTVPKPDGDCYGPLVHGLAREYRLRESVVLLMEMKRLGVSHVDKWNMLLRNRCIELGLQHPAIPPAPNAWMYTKSFNRRWVRAKKKKQGYLVRNKLMTRKQMVLMPRYGQALK